MEIKYDFIDMGVDISEEANAILTRIKKGDSLWSIKQDFLKLYKKWREEYVPEFAKRMDETYENTSEMLKDMYIAEIDYEIGSTLTEMLEQFVYLMEWKSDRMCLNAFMRLNSCIEILASKFERNIERIDGDE